MRFRLYYEGSFKSSNGDPGRKRRGGRAQHKHEIRSVLHRQLRDLWRVRSALKGLRTDGEIFGQSGKEMLLSEKLLEISPKINGYRFVPLVHEAFDLTCSVNVLIFRRDRPGRILHARDIDNRLKTLFDALRMPNSSRELGEAQAGEDDNPMFVLAQSDELISHVSVETDDFLDPPEEAGEDDSYARVIIGVELKPFNVNMLNMNFA